MAKKQDSKAIARYKKENYDRISIDLPKGEREIIKEHVDLMGTSIQAYIREAIYAAINEDRERMLLKPAPYVPREVTKEEIDAARPHMPRGFTDGQIKKQLLEFDKWEYELENNPKRPTKLRSYEDWEFEFTTGEDIDLWRMEQEAERQRVIEQEHLEMDKDAVLEGLEEVGNEIQAAKEAKVSGDLSDEEYQRMMAIYSKRLDKLIEEGVRLKVVRVPEE